MVNNKKIVGWGELASKSKKSRMGHFLYSETFQQRIYYIFSYNKSLNAFLCKEILKFDVYNYPCFTYIY